MGYASMRSYGGSSKAMASPMGLWQRRPNGAEAVQIHVHVTDTCIWAPWDPLAPWGLGRTSHALRGRAQAQGRAGSEAPHPRNGGQRKSGRPSGIKFRLCSGNHDAEVTLSSSMVAKFETRQMRATAKKKFRPGQLAALAEQQELKIMRTKSPETLRVSQLVKAVFPGAKVVK
jgi:hypothetical protein